MTWTGGAILGAGTTNFAHDVTISGVNTKVVAGGRVLNLNGTTNWSGNTAANNNAIQFWNGATINNNGTFNDANPFASFIEHNVGGPHNFNNVGTYNKLSNTVTTVDLGVGFNNSGTLNIDAGTMRFVSGTQGPTGTVNVASGATYQHDANSTMGTLHTAGTLNLGANTLTIFARLRQRQLRQRQRVQPARQRDHHAARATASSPPATPTRASPARASTNGNTATPTLLDRQRPRRQHDLHATTSPTPARPGRRCAARSRPASTAATSPTRASRAAASPPATGGRSRPAASLSRDVVVTVGAAGSLAPLTGQSVAIVNNFDNTRSQVVTFGLAPGAAAYRLAEANTLGPVAFGNVHVGDVVGRALTISNLAVNDGFSEKLNASFGSANDPRNHVRGRGQRARRRRRATRAA